VADEALPRTGFADLDRRAQKRLLLHSGVRITLSIAAMFVLYAILPDAHTSSLRAIVELLLGLVAFAVLLGWQIRRILVATYPGLQAIEALALALAVLIVVFAYSYLSLSRANAGNFSEPLDHVTAVYFTVVTFGTVGFGDIVPRTDATRVLVTVQIVLDLVLLAGIARTIVFAAKLGARRRETERSQ
jgi:voltage-gated potassium channel